MLNNHIYLPSRPCGICCSAHKASIDWRRGLLIQKSVIGTRGSGRLRAPVLGWDFSSSSAVTSQTAWCRKTRRHGWDPGVKPTLLFPDACTSRLRGREKQCGNGPYGKGEVAGRRQRRREGRDKWSKRVARSRAALHRRGRLGKGCVAPGMVTEVETYSGPWGMNCPVGALGTQLFYKRSTSKELEGI